jgi:hypothetical protein
MLLTMMMKCVEGKGITGRQIDDRSCCTAEKCATRGEAPTQDDDEADDESRESQITNEVVDDGGEKKVKD